MHWPDPGGKCKRLCTDEATQCQHRSNQNSHLVHLQLCSQARIVGGVSMGIRFRHSLSAILWWCGIRLLQCRIIPLILLAFRQIPILLFPFDTAQGFGQFYHLPSNRIILQ